MPMRSVSCGASVRPSGPVRSYRLVCGGLSHVSRRHEEARPPADTRARLPRPETQTAAAGAFIRRSRRTEVTAVNVLRAYARLAFAYITNVITVSGHAITVRGLDDLPPDVTTKIAEVAQTKGGACVKFHSKTQALDAIARHFGLFQDKLEVRVRHDMRQVPLNVLPVLEQTALEREERKA